MCLGCFFSTKKIYENPEIWWKGHFHLSSALAPTGSYDFCCPKIWRKEQFSPFRDSILESLCDFCPIWKKQIMCVCVCGRWKNNVGFQSQRGIEVQDSRWTIDFGKIVQLCIFLSASEGLLLKHVLVCLCYSYWINMKADVNKHFK